LTPSHSASSLADLIEVLPGFSPSSSPSVNLAAAGSPPGAGIKTTRFPLPLLEAVREVRDIAARFLLLQPRRLASQTRRPTPWAARLETEAGWNRVGYKGAACSNLVVRTSPIEVIKPTGPCFSGRLSGRSALAGVACVIFSTEFHGSAEAKRKARPVLLRERVPCSPLSFRLPAWMSGHPRSGPAWPGPAARRLKLMRSQGPKPIRFDWHLIETRHGAGSLPERCCVPSSNHCSINRGSKTPFLVSCPGRGDPRKPCAIGRSQESWGKMLESVPILRCCILSLPIQAAATPRRQDTRAGKVVLAEFRLPRAP